MGEYLIGIDAGCTSSKVVLFDKTGKVVSSAATPSMRRIVFSKGTGIGFEEFDVDELWSLISKCIKETIEKAQIKAADIEGIGVTSFGNGVVFLDKDGGSIAPGCFSQDYRANEILDLYKKEGSYEKINEIVKGTLFAGEPGPILRWYKEHEREIYNNIGGILTFKDYIMYRLTNVFATDLNVFGGSFMLDLSTMDYSKQLLELYGIPELFDKLPKLASSPEEVVGKVSLKAAAATGLYEGTPVVAGMMDILACLVGAGAANDGVVTSIAGSWCINETHSSRIIPNASSNMPYIKKGEYLNCSYTGASASNYEWFTTTLCDRARIIADKKGISMFDVLDEEIQSVSPEYAKLLFLPYVASPSLNVNAKAGFLNIDAHTSFADLCYAVVEGIAFIHKYHIDFLKKSGLQAEVIRLTGGMSKSKVWTQIFADVVQIPVEIVDCNETGALGAAIAAGIGAGVYKSYEDAFDVAVKIKNPLQPNAALAATYTKRYAKWWELNKAMEIYWDRI